MLKKVTLIAGCVAFLSGNAMASTSMAGKALFDSNCASCHGADGQGSKMGAKLKPFPARNLTALAATVDRDELRRIIA